MPRPIFRSILPIFFVLTVAISPCARAQGTITTVAGDGHGISSGTVAGDGGAAVQGHFEFPVAVARDAAGNLFVADPGNRRVRRVDAVTGIITTVAGTGAPGLGRLGGPATATSLNSPSALAFDGDGNLYIVDGDGILMVSHGGDGMITGATNETTAEVPLVSFLSGVPFSLSLYGPWNVGAPGLSHPKGLVALGSGSALTLLIADTGHNRVLSVTGVGTADELVTRMAGEPENPSVTCLPFVLGDGGAAKDACLNPPTGLALDNAGNLFIADSTRIRRVDQAQLLGVITTVAGGPFPGFGGDGGPATAAGFGLNISIPDNGFLGAVSFDGNGNLYVADKYNLRIRRIVPGADGLITGASDEIISTVAGGGNPQDGLGDGGPATAATFGFVPEGLTVDSSGNLYVADTGNVRVRLRDAATGLIRTVAGDGQALSSGIVAGDGGPATQGHFEFPIAVARDVGGNLFIADSLNHCVRRVGASTGIITTVVGNPNAHLPGDGGPATAAGLNSPAGLAFDDEGNLYVADSGSNNIRMVSHGGDGMITGAANETITTVPIVTILSGLPPNAPWNGGADGLSHPTNLLALGAGSALTLLIADTGHDRVLSVTGIGTTGELISRLAGEPQPPILITCLGQNLGDGGPPVIFQEVVHSI